MTTTLAPAPSIPFVPPLPAETLAEMLERLGDVPVRRVRMTPMPGTATEQDLIEFNDRKTSLCELVDGVLVEKAMGSPSALVAMEAGRVIGNFNKPRRLGVVLGADGMVRLLPGRVRMPDVSFISWDRLPGRRVPTDLIWRLAPDLAIEVLSPSNTPREMQLKRRECFASGTRLVWEIDPETRTANVYTTPDAYTTLDATQSLDGGDVLPGFTLPLGELFAVLDEEGPPPA